MNKQDNMSSPEARNHIIIGPEKSNLAESQDKILKIAVMGIFKDLKEDMNKYLCEDCENTIS